ncbi:hypothetical protein ACP275_03G097600 [Erythranthe tilingii]
MNMNKFSCILPIFLVVTSSYLICPSLSDQRTQDLISQICGGVSDHATCAYELNDHLPSPETDLPGLTRLTVDLTLALARDAERIFGGRREHEDDERLIKLYGFCETKYHSAVGFAEGAKYDADRGDFKSMVYLLQLCAPPIIECQNAPGANDIFVLRSRNEAMRTFISMGLKEGSLF